MREALSRTGGALSLVAARRDARAVLAVGASAYLVAYSFAVGDLALTGRGGVAVLVVDDPLRRAIEPTAPFSFEPIAALGVGPFTYLFSPIDAALAVVLAVLVGVNVALSYLTVVQPRACGIDSSAGLIAAVPALLSGAACCGPVVLLALGVQATGLLVSGFEVLVPLALVFLVASLVLVGRQVDPTLV